MNSEESTDRDNSQLAIESAKLDKDEERLLADLGVEADLELEPEY